MALLSYNNQAEKDADKALLDKARVALDIAENALCLDNCNVWQLYGKKGRIVTFGDGESYLLHLHGDVGHAWGSQRAWAYAKRRLYFCEQITGFVVTEAFGSEDEDEPENEGEFVSRFRLPITPAQAIVVRELAWLPQQLDDEPGIVRICCGPPIYSGVGMMGRTRWPVTFNGKPYDRPLALPFYDGARALLALGYPSDTRLELVDHSRPDFVRLRSQPGVGIGQIAEWTLSEGDYGGIRRMRYVPFDGCDRVKKKKNSS